MRWLRRKLYSWESTLFWWLALRRVGRMAWAPSMADILANHAWHGCPCRLCQVERARAKNENEAQYKAFMDLVMNGRE